MVKNKIIRRCDLVPQYEKYRHEIHGTIERVLKSGRYTLGEEVEAFEKEFEGYLGTKHVVSVGNGTDGLILALKALTVERGDEVITTPFTAIPTVSAIIAVGAKPVFVDICSDTFLLDIDKVADAITKKTKAVIPVHIFGNVVDIPRLRRIAGFNLPIVEDACQAHGSTLNGIKAGSMGDIGVFSFYPTKNLGGYGDGGAVVTDNMKIADNLRLLRMYGMIDKDHIVINGVNSRLDELQAAILRLKLRHLDKMNQLRNEIATKYRERLSSRYFTFQHIPNNVYCNWHVFSARFQGDRNKLIDNLEKKQIQTNVYYILPLHLQEANRHIGYRRGDFHTAEELCDEIVALPLYAELESYKTDRVIDEINKFIKLQ